MNPQPYRRRARRPAPLAARGDDAPVELDIRIRPGTESAVIAELRQLGASSVEQRPAGELRVTPGGPLRPLLSVKGGLAIYAVRALPDMTLADLDSERALEVAVELAGVAMNVVRSARFATMRVTAGPEVTGDRSKISRLAGGLTRRLGLRQAPVAPDLVVIVRRRAQGLELAARLPLPEVRPD